MCYAYNADIYCDDCGGKIREELDGEGFEDTGDTDEYPQYFDDDESDCPQHCGDCHVFLENSLTSDGYEYAKQAVEEAVRRGDDDSVALTEWAPFYGIDTDNGSDDGPCEGDFTLTPCGPFGGKTALGRVHDDFISEFDCDEDAIRATRDIMEREQFWPNIWVVSDHGNWSLYND